MGDGGKIDNPWLGLSRDAHAKSDRLQLDPGSAEAGAKYAAEAINALNAAKSYAYLLDQYSGFSNNGVLQSALNLQDRFAKEGGRVGGIIDDYISLLNAMGDTFMAAGKTYRETDDQSKSDFDKLKTQAVIDTHFDGIPLDGTTQLSSWSDASSPAPSDSNGMGDMAKLAKARSGRYTDPIGSEDPTHHDGKWFFDVGQGIDPTPIANRSALWKWIAQVIGSSFETLTGAVKRLESDGHWTGRGADAAVAACQAFEAQGTAFSTDLWAVAENLLYTATWLNQTKAGMPRNWEDSFKGTSTETYIINTGTAAFTAWYIPGIGNSSTTIPILVDPTKPPTQNPSGSPRSDYSGNRPNPTSGGPTGRVTPSGPGGGDPGGGDPGAKTPGGKTDPKGAHPGKDDPKDKDHKDPNGKDGKDPHGKDGKDPNGKDPTGKNPTGTSPNGSNPDGANANSSNPSSSSNSGQSALSGLQSALQSLTSQGTQTTDKKAQDLKDQLRNSPLTNLLDDLKVPPGGSPGGGGPGGSPLEPLAAEVANARLFPRAAVAEEVESSIAGVARAGVAPGSGTTGMGGGMGGMGHGGGAHGAQGKEHKRPDFLDSNEYLDEAMGTAPIVAKPVVEG
ncbi:hypothetical protein [Nocardia aurantiaca]|uniref:hypothetical protein n=1 Tax=Nocardia aurantiaca TaxID=2675850 RepID=UPI0018A96977|nr:hypothetical protein [Nocardia aurantiaca]